MSGKRTPWVRSIRLLLPVVLLAGVVSFASAQQMRPHIGVRGGGNFDYNDAVLGAHVLLPVAKWLDVYPSFDAYFPNTGTRLGFNADLKYRIPTNTSVGFYTGGGFNLLYRKINGVSDNDPGVNLLGGLETRQGWVHPFVEGRVLWHDNTSFQMMAGLNFTLGNTRQR